MIPRTLILASLLAGFMSCSHKADEPFPRVVRSSPIDSLNQLLLAKLSDSRVLMLGDTFHHQGFFLRKVTTLLDHWLDGVASDSRSNSNPRKVFLFLEQMQYNQDVWERYFESGDFTEYLNSQVDHGIREAGAFTSFDEMEFLFDLRQIEKRIAALNSLRTGNDRVELRVIGAECDPPFTHGEKGDPKTVSRARTEYFIYQRDECSSKRIFDFMRANPEFKAVVFIGQGHLERRRVDKNEGAQPKLEGPQYSYFMTHYLDGYFGRENVTVARFFGQGRNWQTNYIDCFAGSELGPDINIYVASRPPMPTPLYLFKNRKLLGVYRRLLDVQSHSSDAAEREKARWTAFIMVLQFRRSHLQLEEESRRLIDSLYAHRNDIDRDSTAPDRLLGIADRLAQRFDVFTNIDHFADWSCAPGIPDSEHFSWAARCWYNNLPADSSLEEPIRSLSPGGAEGQLPLDSLARREFVRRKQELTTYFLVNLLWIATEEEKATALKILQKRTRERFTDAKSWIRWWRQRNWGEDVAGKRRKANSKL